MKKDELVGYLAAGLSLEQIGNRVGRNPSTISYHLRKHGLKPVNQGQHANKGAIPREELEVLVQEGLSLAQIGARLNRCPATIRHWIRKYGFETARMTLRRPELREAKQSGVKYIESTCIHHGAATFVLENTGYYRCLKCRQHRVSEWRRRAKRRLIERAGGACVLCGYSRWQGALEFHHLDPSKKAFGLSARGLTRSIEKLKAEADKCVLLCANCHAEVEGGFVTLPSQPRLAA